MQKEVLATASRPDHARGTSPGTQADRRSLYVHVKRSLRPPLMEAFDQPDPDLPCPVRFPTNVPTQALMTLNGDWAHDMAGRFAERLRAEAEGEREQLARGVLLALGRPATTAELDRSQDFLARLRDETGIGADAALPLFCLGLFNRNEFLWID